MFIKSLVQGELKTLRNQGFKKAEWLIGAVFDHYLVKPPDVDMNCENKESNLMDLCRDLLSHFFDGLKTRPKLEVKPRLNHIRSFPHPDKKAFDKRYREN